MPGESWTRSLSLSFAHISGILEDNLLTNQIMFYFALLTLPFSFLGKAQTKKKKASLSFRVIVLIHRTNRQSPLGQLKACEDLRSVNRRCYLESCESMLNNIAIKLGRSNSYPVILY